VQGAKIKIEHGSLHYMEGKNMVLDAKITGVALTQVRDMADGSIHFLGWPSLFILLLFGKSETFLVLHFCILMIFVSNLTHCFILLSPTCRASVPKSQASATSGPTRATTGTSSWIWITWETTWSSSTDTSGVAKELYALLSCFFWFKLLLYFCVSAYFLGEHQSEANQPQRLYIG
jgi:hypothetical protein